VKESFLLTVTYKARPGMAEEFVRAVAESGVQAAIRAEEGCILYDYYFSAEDADTVLLFEEWESCAHQEVHMKAPHIPKLLEIVEKYTEEHALRIL